MRKLILLFVAMLICGLTFGCAAQKFPVPTGGATPTPAPTTTPSVIEVTIDDLFAAYKSNPIAADMKYNDKVIRINGQVWEIRAGEPPVVMLQHEVHCSFDKKYLPLLAQLRKDEMVAVEGRLESCTIRLAYLQDCVLISPPQPPTTTVITIEIGFVIATNWDADPEIDGIKVEIVPIDAHDLLVKAPGIVSAELWLQKDFSREGKDRLVQSWRISVDETDYVNLGGAVVRLEYSGFVPTYNQWGTLELTFTTTDGKSFTARWRNIHLAE